MKKTTASSITLFRLTSGISLQANDYFMYSRFNIQQIYVLPTQCIYVFCVELRTNRYYFTVQH